MERELREQYPHAAELHKGLYHWCDQRGIPKRPKLEDTRAVAQFEKAYDDYQAECESLSTAEDAAYQTFFRLRDIREGLKVRGWWYRPFQPGWTSDFRWRHLDDSLTLDCPELDRLWEISDQTVTRSQECWRARGREMLADLASGEAWESEVERRAELEEHWKQRQAWA